MVVKRIANVRATTDPDNQGVGLDSSVWSHASIVMAVIPTVHYRIRMWLEHFLSFGVSDDAPFTLSFRMQEIFTLFPS